MIGASWKGWKRQSNRLQSERKPSKIYAVGLVRSIGDIQPKMMEWLAEVNCRHNIVLHVVAGGDKNAGDNDSNNRKDDFRKKLHQIYTTKQNGIFRSIPEECAPVYLVEDAEVGTSSVNRIERVAKLRDFQRESVRALFQQQTEVQTQSFSESSVIIVLDLDLADILSAPSEVIRVAEQMVSHSNGFGMGDADGFFPFDGICAAGITDAVKLEPWYYDTFATVLLPDTYVHPLQKREIKWHYDGEDPALVRSDDRNGSWTQGDIMKWFQERASQSNEGVVPVRSCFGGLAIYRASVWLEPSCSYSQDPSGLERYYSSVEHRPCEHIVFHNCLHENIMPSRGGLAVMPQIMTLWKKNKIENSAEGDDDGDNDDYYVQETPSVFSSLKGIFSNMIIFRNEE